MIVKNGNPILTKPCEFLTKENYRGKVSSFLNRSIPHRNDGVGIAANQIGMSVMVFVIATGNIWKTFINPKIKRSYGEKINNIEGCLSIPGKHYEVKRYTKVDIEFYDYDFKKQNKTYEWPEAVIIQHEVDHLNGYLISMKGTEHIE